MIRFAAAAAASAVLALIASSAAAAFEAAPAALDGFRSATLSAAFRAVPFAEVPARLELWAPLLLVAVAALYALTASRIARR